MACSCTVRSFGCGLGGVAVPDWLPGAARHPLLCVGVGLSAASFPALRPCSSEALVPLSRAGLMCGDAAPKRLHRSVESADHQQSHQRPAAHHPQAVTHPLPCRVTKHDRPRQRHDPGRCCRLGQTKHRRWGGARRRSRASRRYATDHRRAPGRGSQYWWTAWCDTPTTAAIPPRVAPCARTSAYAARSWGLCASTAARSFWWFSTTCRRCSHGSGRAVRRYGTPSGTGYGSGVVVASSVFCAWSLFRLPPQHPCPRQPRRRTQIE